MAAEAGAERTHPPEPALSIVVQRAFEDVKHEWAADVAEFAQHIGAPACVVLSEIKLLP